jgi:DNA replication and repair protein RecF
VRISEVQIEYFRNIQSVSFVPNSAVNFFIGANGQGKTSLLEAIYACLKGDSFRPYSKRLDWKSRLSGTPVTSQVRLKVRDEREADWDVGLQSTEKSWMSFFNQKRISRDLLTAKHPVVCFSPDDHSIIRGDPDLRRSFLDSVLIDVCPGYSELLGRYQNCLKQRNKLLRDLKNSPDKNTLLRDQLSIWTENLALNCIDLVKLKFELWPIYEKYFFSVSKKIFSSIEQESLSLKFMPHLVADENELSLEFVRRQLNASLEADLATGWTHRGPHRDDFEIFFNYQPSRTCASQGQARLLALTLKWAHSAWIEEQRSEKPIFLVDDFSSELDARRRSKLLELFQQDKWQIFITSTDHAWVDSLAFSDYTIFEVFEGGISPQNNSKMGALDVRKTS